MIRKSLCIAAAGFLAPAVFSSVAQAQGPDWTPSETFNDCSAKGKTRIDGDACLDAEASRVNGQLAQNLDAVRARLTREASGASGEPLAAFEKTEAAFEDYRKAECGAVSEFWAGGSARYAETTRCHIRLTVARTHELWRHFLTYVDRTPPVLPEP